MLNSTDQQGRPWGTETTGRRLPHQRLEYEVAATITIDGIEQNATLTPPLPFIRQDEVDTLRQEYLDFNRTHSCTACFTPARAQVVTPLFREFNTGNYAVVADELSTDNLTRLAASIQEHFATAFFTDVQVRQPGATCPLDQPNCTVVFRGLNIATSGRCTPRTGNGDPRNCPSGADISASISAGFFTEPQGDDVCQERNVLQECLGPITAGQNNRAETTANNRPLTIPALRFIVTSAYRNPQRNLDVGSSARNSRHVRSRAIDIDPRTLQVPGVSSSQLMCMIERAGDLAVGENMSYTEIGGSTFVKCSHSGADHVHIQN